MKTTPPATDARVLQGRTTITETQDWNRLVGRTVNVWLAGHYIRTAQVDDAAADSSVLWLRSYAYDRRQLITTSDGYVVQPLE
jgi:hypothetical protein